MDSIHAAKIVIDSPHFSSEVKEALRGLVKDAQRFEWLAERGRYASVLIDFTRIDPETRSANYIQHRVSWHVEDEGWLDASGDGIRAAVDAAMGCFDAIGVNG